MPAQNRFTFTEDFSDIQNWSFGQVSGTFISGAGSQHWKGLPAGGSGNIPNGSKITAATTSFSTSETSGGLHRINGSLALLSTGTVDNGSSSAMDLYLNFSGLKAGKLSFNWASVNNSSGNRKSSLRVYASVDNVSFTEIPAAQVLNFTNNSATAGLINHINLPSFLDGSSTALLRFYYNNGTGGTTGSRPKISIDNIKITGVPASICSTPSAQPINLILNSINPGSINGTFSRAAPSADTYLVLATTNNSISEFPQNGRFYNIGENIGDAIVVSNIDTSFIASGLNASTTYYFFVFSSNAICSGGPLYQLQAPLSNFATTSAGNLQCQAPNTQPTDLIFTSQTTNSIQGSFTPALNTDRYLLLRTAGSALNALPLNGTQYNPGDSLGNAIIVSASAGVGISNSGLEPATNYSYFIFGYNNEACNNGPIYNLQFPLNASTATIPLSACKTPSSQPTNLNLSASNTFVSGVFNAATEADEYLTIYSSTSTLNASPANGTIYSVGSFLGNGIVASNSSATAFRINNLQPGTNYYLFVFAVNTRCTGGPLYNINSPLTTQTTTTNVPLYNYYFGNLHAHSRFSDGNKDNINFQPADNYSYAKNSLCMDFLGISEHNHAGAGMNLQNWLPGFTQAQSATTSNFLALYGMEWGVISSGGHVLVYGVDKLLGWEANNYDHYVAKSDYTGTPQTTGTTGLFRFINSWGNNAFAVLAHPGSADYNALLQQNYNATADSAIAGAALESGPAFSTATNYNNPGTSMSYLSYYKKMLAKGYRLGPSVDHDNHYTTFGRTTNSRLAVIAPTLNHTDFFTAIRNRNFYATQDCDTRISFMLNNEIMGSDFSGAANPSININVTDPSNTSAIANIKIMKGTPGSSVEAIEVFSITNNNVNFTDLNLQISQSAYYYADILMGGLRSITAPIWYTKNYGNVLSAELISFNAEKTTTPSVIVSWSVFNEENTEKYIVEKSENGVDFKNIQQVLVMKSAQGIYKFLDLYPFSGLNYYRLKMAGKDGKFIFSKVVAVNFKDAGEFDFQVYPNPFRNYVQLNIKAPLNAEGMIHIHDMYGRKLNSKTILLKKGAQLIQLDLSLFASGNYFITLQVKGNKISKKIVKQ